MDEQVFQTLVRFDEVAERTNIALERIVGALEKIAALRPDVISVDQSARDEIIETLQTYVKDGAGEHFLGGLQSDTGTIIELIERTMRREK